MNKNIQTNNAKRNPSSGFLSFFLIIVHQVIRKKFTCHMPLLDKRWNLNSRNAEAIWATHGYTKWLQLRASRRALLVAASSARRSFLRHRCFSCHCVLGMICTLQKAAVIFGNYQVCLFFFKCICCTCI